MKYLVIILCLFYVLTASPFWVAEAKNPFWDGVYAAYDTKDKYVGDVVVEATGPNLKFTHANGQVTDAVFVEFRPGQHFIKVSAWGNAEGRCTEVGNVCRQIWWSKGNNPRVTGTHWGRKDIKSPK